MPLHYISVGTSTDPKTLIASVNTLITQMNGTAGKLQGTLNAQNNAISNLPNPTASGDAVNLGYLNNALSTLTASINDTLNRANNGYRNKPKPYHCIFKAALAQQGTALLGMNFVTSTSSATGSSVAPTGTVIAIGDLYFAGMAFTGTGNNIFVQEHFPLPEDWVPSSLDCVVNWYGPDGGGDIVTWNVQFAHATNGAAGAQHFNPIASATSTVASGPGFAISTITNVFVTSNATNGPFRPGDEIFFKFGASGITGTAVLIDLKFLVRRQSG